MRRILRAAVSVFVLSLAIGGVAVAQTAKPAKKAAATKAMTARGTVKSVGDATLVLDAAGKDMTFTLDANTKAVARGAGTKSKAMGGKGQVTAFVHAGDTVTVSYHKTGDTMHASQVSVTARKK
jgi:hypothetical protein